MTTVLKLTVFEGRESLNKSFLDSYSTRVGDATPTYRPVNSMGMMSGRFEKGFRLDGPRILPLIIRNGVFLFSGTVRNLKAEKSQTKKERKKQRTFDSRAVDCELLFQRLDYQRNQDSMTRRHRTDQTA